MMSMSLLESLETKELTLLRNSQARMPGFGMQISGWRLKYDLVTGGVAKQKAALWNWGNSFSES